MSNEVNEKRTIRGTSENFEVWERNGIVTIYQVAETAEILLDATEARALLEVLPAMIASAEQSTAEQRARYAEDRAAGAKAIARRDAERTEP